jgi:hypothetical protein
MAGDWIKLDTNTIDKPEVIRMARILGMDRYAVFGRLLRFWSWIDAITEDGNVAGLTREDVDAVVDADAFASALEAVGWLVIHKSQSGFTVPKFDRHNGKSAKKRALTSERQRRWRNADVDGKASTGALPEKRREEKRKEEEKKRTRPASPPADPRDGGARLGAAPPTPSAGEAPKPPRTPAQRAAGLTHLSAVLRQVLPEEPDTEAVKAELETKAPIPIPTDEEQPPLAAASP